MKRMTTKTMSALIMMVAFFSLILVGIPSAAVADDGGCGCTCETPGYWKQEKHPWPVNVIEIDGIFYSKEEAIDWLKTSVAKDKSITMFKALVAAKLNVESGCSVCDIDGPIGAAEAWLAANPVGSEVAASSEAWQVGECLYETLDIYNNTCQYIDVCNFCE